MFIYKKRETSCLERKFRILSLVIDIEILTSIHDVKKNAMEDL